MCSYIFSFSQKLPHMSLFDDSQWYHTRDYGLSLIKVTLTKKKTLILKSDKSWSTLAFHVFVHF